MIRVLGCTFGGHNLALVALAALLCVFSCAAAIVMLQRARQLVGHPSNIWIAGAGGVGGFGIWATHFVAMLAYRTNFPIAFDPAITAISVVIAALLCTVGFAMSLTRAGPLLGGAVTGLAIGIMHYVGMAAVRAPAVTIWDPDYVAASLVVGVVLMSCGMQVALRSDDRKSLPGGVALFTLAICGLHFTGMTAFSLRPDPTVAIPYVAIAPVTLAVGIAAVAFFALSTALAIVLFDRQKTHLRQLQATTGKLEHLSAELRKALDDAHTANRAKTIFFASMSHELRTPLNAILGFSEMLLMEAVAPLGHPRNAEYVRDIHASGLRLMSLINDILDISRAEAGKMQLHDTTIDLDKLAAAALRLVEIQAAKGKVSLFCEFARDVPRIFGDRKRLEQVLLNLLSNAIKFTPEGGRVTVRIVREGEGVRIDVSDTGIGIAESDIETVLSPFAQVDSYLSRKHDGTGLGLPIAKKLVELHGGTLCMRSQPGAGTTVTITLPLSRPDCADTGAQDDPGRSMLQVADG